MLITMQIYTTNGAMAGCWLIHTQCQSVVRSVLSAFPASIQVARRHSPSSTPYRWRSSHQRQNHICPA